MSAYTVSDAHINALVTWGSDYYANSHRISYFHDGQWKRIFGDEQRIASVLRGTNEFRYTRVTRRSQSVPSRGWYARIREAQSGARAFTSQEIIKACHGYTYKSHSTNGWKESEAHAIIKALELHAVRVLPGYKEASTWSIEKLITA